MCIRDRASALGERRAQEVEEQYSREEQALANMYANGQITEAQYLSLIHIFR